MDEKKEKNLLYFGDDEIVKEKTANKQVFVTKRINGKETHTKIERPVESEYKRVPNTQGFNFEREIVIGVNTSQAVKAQSESNSKKKGSKHNKVKKSKNVKTKNKVQTANASRKNTKISKSKRKKVNKAIPATIAIVLIAIAIVVIAFATPIFNITEIKVEGNSRVTSTNIINLSGLKLSQNIFNNSKKSIINNIKENQYIEKVTVSRKLPGTVKIVVTEREIAYQIKLMSSYIYIDKQGNILENSSIKENVAILEGESTKEEELINGKTLNEQDVQKLTKVSKIIDAMKTVNIDASKVSVNIEDEENFILYMESENKKIYIGDATNLPNKMLYVSKILELESGHSGIIFVNGDLNSGFKPYFREEQI